MRKKFRRLFQRLNWDQAEINDFRQQILMNIASLSMFFYLEGSLGNYPTSISIYNQEWH